MLLQSLKLRQHRDRNWKAPVLMHRPYPVPVKVDIETPKSVLAHTNIKVNAVLSLLILLAHNINYIFQLSALEAGL